MDKRFNDGPYRTETLDNLTYGSFMSIYKDNVIIGEIGLAHFDSVLATPQVNIRWFTRRNGAQRLSVVIEEV